MHSTDLLSRRQIVMGGVLGAAAWLVPGAFAEELIAHAAARPRGRSIPTSCRSTPTTTCSSSTTRSRPPSARSPT